MKSPICAMLGIDFPLLAFSHCRDVVAAVSRAGGFGVLGATGHTLESLETELAWIDAHVDGKPYGLDVLIPENLATGGAKGLTRASIMDKVPAQHRAFVGELAEKHHFTMPEERADSAAPAPFDPNLALAMLDVAFRHPIKLIANALGVPPQAMIDLGHKHGVPVAALVGAKEHAIRQVDAGVDILVVQGGEAGGHCGEVSTIVLIPEVIRALEAHGKRVPVLAAGGIMTGGQMAGMMAMGADGAWTGSVWLATPESECSDVFREKMVAATSRDTVRSKSRTGKPSRQLRSAWTDAWEGPTSPGPLPMPYQSLISEPAIRACDLAAQKGDPAAREMVTYFVGQGVGLVDQVRPAGQVVQDFKMEFAEAIERITTLVGD
ncbi:NAD(P)H-dependent flavin oxidoreductase [Sphingomonas radiodurans]|uniref:NAD(P)H-dependent flavin oxidoreductase n=1 Tax=Sphingomonas radiodurans TaxID=2890321 RepID=UPI001E4311B8|nr:nitronate monooxygenase family protein [Sphingomonas radiodurans]WBH17277.1 nitronate monooxygenase family protein [Sphingomonas radiodurans]